MQILAPIEKSPTVEQVILETPVNGEVKIHADRLPTFKSEVSRLNRGKKTGRILFSYSGIKQEYYTATRIS
jgi:hypothetical protein